MSRRGLLIVVLCALVAGVVGVSALRATSVARQAMAEQVRAGEELAASERSLATSQAVAAASQRLEELAARAARLEGLPQTSQLALALGILMAEPAAKGARIVDASGEVAASIGEVVDLAAERSPTFVAPSGSRDAVVLLRAPVRMPGEGGFEGHVVQELSVADLVPGFGRPFAAFDGATSLVQRDGTLLMTTSTSKSSKLLAPELLDLVASGASGYLEYWSPRFQSDRVGVTNPVAGTDLVVVVSADARAVAGPATDLVRELFGVLAATAAVAGVLVGGIVLLARRSRRHLAHAASLAVVDPLTGLTNRRGLDERIASMGAAAVIAVDLDGLKIRNDTYGHASGDEAIVAVAKALRDAVRTDDLVARVGGDEFIVVMPGADLARAQRAVDAVRAALDADDVRVSVGIAIAPSGSVRDALALADEDLYVNKRARAAAITLV